MVKRYKGDRAPAKAVWHLPHPASTRDLAANEVTGSVRTLGKRRDFPPPLHVARMIVDGLRRTIHAGPAAVPLHMKDGTMHNTVAIPSVPVPVLKTERKASKRINPGDMATAWVVRRSMMLDRIMRAASKGAEAVGKKAAETTPWDARERVSNVLSNEKYFQILDTVGRAAELAAARAAGYPTWGAFEAARRAQWAAPR